MSAYFITQITIDDPIEYEKYLDGFDDVFSKYRGEVLAVDDEPALLEGDFRHHRVVLIRFQDEAELKRWYDSPEYQQLAKYRHRSARADILLVHGYD
ncbi:MAG: DUF1330 domain-containing protein [Candidatus Neomarinimicrobiota bacterium]